MNKVEKIRQWCCMAVVMVSLITSQSAFANDKLIDIINNQTRQIQELRSRIDELDRRLLRIDTQISQAKDSFVPRKEGDMSNTADGKENSAEVIEDVNVSKHQRADSHGDGNKYDDAAVGVLAAGDVEHLDDKKAYDMALMLIKDSKFKEAEKQFSNFMRDYPDSNLRDKASFWYAESFYRQGVYSRSAAEYLNSYKTYPKGSKAAEALLKLSYSLNALNKQKEACSILAKLEKEFPNRSNQLMIRSEDAKARMKCGNNHAKSK